MTKAALCIACSDIVAPFRPIVSSVHSSVIDRRWRLCECGQTGVRWRNSAAGLLEVTALGGPDAVRVIGFNNMFLHGAVDGYGTTAKAWRDLHAYTCGEVEPHYLFHTDRRACWALVIRPGETGDVTFVDYAEALTPGSSAERAPTS